jgi:hypothetical protein
MNTRMLVTSAAAAVLVSVVACGGGGDDEAGSSTPFSAQPSTLTITAAASSAGGPPTGLCGAGYAGEVFIYGGVAPYQIDNTTPDAVAVSKTQVGDRAGSFSVSFTAASASSPGIGTCVSPALIIVRDKLDKQIIVTVNNKPAG